MPGRPVQKPSNYPSARGPSTSGGTLTTPISRHFFTASTSAPLFVLSLVLSAVYSETHLMSSSRYALRTGPAILSIFTSGKLGMPRSAREGPSEIIRMGFFCSCACFTRRNAEYVARDVPIISNCDALSRTSTLVD